MYSLTYQKKESLFKATIKNWNEITNQTWTQNQNLWSDIQNSTNLNSDIDSIQKIKTTDSVSLWDTQPNWVSVSNTQTYNSVSLGSTNIKTLPVALNV